MKIELDFLNDLTPETQEETIREIIIGRIDEGKVVPIIGNAFINDLSIGNHDALVQAWAKFTQYPQPDYNHKLARIAQYIAVHQSSEEAGDGVRVKESYLAFLRTALQARARQDSKIKAARIDEVASEASKLFVSQIARRFNYPPLDSGDENPLLLLAALPLPVFITTSYHDYLEVALKKLGKEPQVEVFRWREGLEGIPSVFDRSENATLSDYSPDPQHPLVYHLFGHDRWSDSLVLTEDDYLDFLTNISKDGGVRALLPRVNQAITESSLALIGYRPRDWDFRALFRGIIAPRPFSTAKASIAIQVEPNDGTPQEYLERYMRQTRFTVEWCKPGGFIHDIYQDWQRLNTNYEPK